MARIGIILLTLFNIGGLIVGSVMSAAGSGSTNVGAITLIVGSIWVLAFTYVSWLLCSKGQNDKGLFVALLTWPAASLFSIALHLGQSTVSNFISDHESPSSEFLLACKAAGVDFLAKPSSPVRSIAYDWVESREQSLPNQNHYIVNASGRIESSMETLPRFSAPIEFVESRCCRFEGRPTNGIGPYIRRPTGKMTDYFGITELTADALVTYKLSKLPSANSDVELEQVIVRVSDRRDSQILATLQYVWDRKNRKLCGTTSNGILDELSFIQKAVDLN